MEDCFLRRIRPLCLLAILFLHSTQIHSETSCDESSYEIARKQGEVSWLDRYLPRPIATFIRYINGFNHFAGEYIKPKELKPLEFLNIIRRAYRSPAEAMDWMHTTYGDDLHTTLPSGRVLILSANPKVMEHVLRDTDRGENFGNFEKDPLQNAGSDRAFGGDNIFTNSGQRWRDQREALLPAFKPSKIHSPDVYGKITSVVQDRVAQLTNRVREGGGVTKVELQREIDGMIFDVALTALFRARLPREVIDQQVIPSFSAVMKWVVIDTALNPTSIHIPDLPALIPGMKGLKESFLTAGQIVDTVIDAYNKSPDAKPDDMLAILMRDKTMSAEQIRKTVLTLIAASYETTASYVTWALYEVSKRRELQDRLAEDLQRNLTDGVIGPKQRIAILESVLDETLRFYTPFYVVSRRSKERTEIDLPEGKYLIPENSTIVFALNKIHRNSDLYGEEKTGYSEEVFEPKRWESGKVRHYAFGHGGRTCLGINFAQAEARVIVSELVKNFDFALAQPGQEVRIASGISTKPDQNILINLSLRSKR